MTHLAVAQTSATPTRPLKARMEMFNHFCSSTNVLIGVSWTKVAYWTLWQWSRGWNAEYNQVQEKVEIGMTKGKELGTWKVFCLCCVAVACCSRSWASVVVSLLEGEYVDKDKVLLIGTS
jgi:hypothetical protein